MANNKNEEIYNASGCIDTTAYKAIKNIKKCLILKLYKQYGRQQTTLPIGISHSPTTVRAAPVACDAFNAQAVAGQKYHYYD